MAQGIVSVRGVVLSGREDRMLKIFGAPHSRAFRVIWLANEIGIPYEHIPVTFSVPNAQCKESWYLELNPNGLVPTIYDGGFVMWESAAINLYLAETYKNSLYPSKPQGRGRMLQWTFFATTEVEPPLITLFRNRIFFPPDQRNETLAVQAEQTLRAKLAILEDQLAKTPRRYMEHGRLYGCMRAVCPHPFEVRPHVLSKT